MSSIRHSVSQWCFPDLPLPELARAGRAMGLASIELLEPADWPVVRAHGLVCALGRGPDTIADSFNRRENHARLVPAFRERLREAAAAGVPNLVCFSGNRRGQGDEEGLETCAGGFRQITSIAEETSVTLCLELLNSKIDHPDYQADRTAWGVELVRRVASPRFKLLYDIYHMAVMGEDVIRVIAEHHACFAHYHTAGVPGRHEIDDTQTLDYPAIMRAIAATGYTGFVGQEFLPRRDPLTSLREAIALCSV
ncbi:MAG TPA: TIM barrel protein [Candidatus Didemnitutus sp.]|jgi:hydroxypyruvate isomerase